jgi:hypothetical protein
MARHRARIFAIAPAHQYVAGRTQVGAQARTAAQNVVAVKKQSRMPAVAHQMDGVAGFGSGTLERLAPRRSQ